MSYHPQSNGMVKRFHCHYGARVTEPMDDDITRSTTQVRSAVKELLGRSAAEMIYGITLGLPGEFTQKYTVDAQTDLNDYSDKLRVAMSRLRLCPTCDTPQKKHFPI